jgi:hypothetical protein
MPLKHHLVAAFEKGGGTPEMFEHVHERLVTLPPDDRDRRSLRNIRTLLPNHAIVLL